MKNCKQTKINFYKKQIVNLFYGNTLKIKVDSQEVVHKKQVVELFLTCLRKIDVDCMRVVH